MDLAEVMRAIGRRWYVLIAGLIITGGLAYGVYQVVPVTYDVKASILLLPPSVQTDPTGEPQVVNPFLNLGGLDVAAGVLAKALTDTASVDLIVPEGSKTEYTVQKDVSVSGSVLEVAVNAESEQVALSTLRALFALAEERLGDLQKSIDAPANTEVRMMVVTDNDVAEPNWGGLIRALIVVGAGGLVLTLLLVISVDALARRRAARKAARDNAVSEPMNAMPDPAPQPVTPKNEPKRSPRAPVTTPRAASLFDQDAREALAAAERAKRVAENPSSS